MNTGIQLYDGQLSMISKPIPKIHNPNDVIVKVSHSGLCETDLSIIAGRYPAKEKLIQGHEFSGVISEIGSSVAHLKVGDRVTVNPYDSCSTCHFCVRGEPQFCLKDGLRTALGYQRDGGWQQFSLVPSHLCHVLPSNMTLMQAAFVQPYSMVLRGWDNLGRIGIGDRILVGGASIMGLLWACLFHHHGHRDITVVEALEHRQRMAMDLELDFRVVHPSELNSEYKASVAQCDHAWGYDVVIDCAGGKKVIEHELKWLRRGGTLLLFGLSAMGTHVSLDVYQIYTKEIKIVTSCLSKFSYARSVNLVQQMSRKYLHCKSLGVQCYHLHDYESAIDSLAKGDITKAVFEMN